MAVHYVYWYWSKRPETDTGLKFCNTRVILHKTRGGSFTIYTDNVTCKHCLKTEEFKKDQITFEIGCDGDLDKWSEYHGNREKEFILQYTKNK